MIRTAYRWDANWKITLLVLLLMLLFLRLGWWQLGRAEEKRELQVQYQARMNLPALSLEQVQQMDDELQAFRLVKLRGVYDNERNILLDNQILHGQVGYRVLSPFTTDAGQALLVNRGWIQGFPDRRIPEIPAQSGEVEIVASVYVPLGKAVLIGEDRWSDQWPVTIQAIDIPRLEQRLDTALFGHSLRILAGYPGALVADWPAVNTGPEKHSGYAVQWFFMAFALLCCWIYVSIRRENA